MYSVLDSDEIGMSYSGDCEEKGFHLMGFLDLGTRHIMTTQKTINSIEDLKNLKIRTMENQVQLDSFTAFGAKPAADGIRRIIHRRCSRTLLTVQKR